MDAEPAANGSFVADFLCSTREVLLDSCGPTWGEAAYLGLNLLFAGSLSIWFIPKATDMMVNSAAGLTAKYLGNRWRTLVINSSTNNPEAILMFVALALRHVGGIGTPLGSNFANIYLIYAVALGTTLFTTRLRDKSKFTEVVAVARKEKMLMAWHIGLAISLFGIATWSYYLLNSQLPIASGNEDSQVLSAERTDVICAAVICGLGVIGYLFFDSRLQRRRPELYEDIDDSSHVASWGQFALGTFGLLIACYLINEMFTVASTAYEDRLSLIFGGAVFAALHYFLGALVTSLPEMHVAMKNYSRATSPDFNTALASASASNMCNLGIAGLGCLVAACFWNWLSGS